MGQVSSGEAHGERLEAEAERVRFGKRVELCRLALKNLATSQRILGLNLDQSSRTWLTSAISEARAQAVFVHEDLLSLLELLKTDSHAVSEAGPASEPEARLTANSQGPSGGAPQGRDVCLDGVYGITAKDCDCPKHRAAREPCTLCGWKGEA